MMGCPDSCEYFQRTEKHGRAEAPSEDEEELRRRLMRFLPWERVRLNKLGQATSRDRFLCEEYNLLGDLIDTLLRHEKEGSMIIAPLEDEDIKRIVSPIIDDTRRFLETCWTCPAHCPSEASEDATDLFQERFARQGGSLDDLPEDLQGMTKGDLLAFDLALAVASATEREIGRAYIVQRLELDEEWTRGVTRLVFEHIVHRVKGCLVCPSDCLRSQEQVAG